MQYAERDILTQARIRSLDDPLQLIGGDQASPEVEHDVVRLVGSKLAHGQGADGARRTFPESERCADSPVLVKGNQQLDQLVKRLC